MEKKIIFLGTSSIYPSKERNHPSVYLQFRDEKILFDCGEGTQRQLAFAGILPTRITKIFLTHWHGDHALGMGGLLQSMGMSQRTKDLHIYGPKGTRENIKALNKIFGFEEQFKIYVEEVQDEIAYENNFFKVESMKVKHRIPCLAYSFIEKDTRKMNMDFLEKYGLKQNKVLGKLQKGEDIEWKGETIKAKDATTLTKGAKITYITDTCYFKKLEDFARDSDLLICEATYASDNEDKANSYTHMTAKNVGLLAKNANVKQLIVTHFSHRYKKPTKIVKEIKETFKKVKAAEDFMEILIG